MKNRKSKLKLGPKAKADGNVFLELMEAAIISGRTSSDVFIGAHEALINYLRQEKNPIPSWNRYPRARDYFTQHDHPSQLATFSVNTLRIIPDGIGSDELRQSG